MIQTLDAEAQSLPERLAILDPSFHPVLSFPHDIPVNAQLEAILKSGKVRPCVVSRTSSSSVVDNSAASPIETGAATVDGLPVSSNASPFTTASSTTGAPSKVSSSSSVSSFGGLLSSKERKREKSLAKKKAKMASAASALCSFGPTSFFSLHWLPVLELPPFPRVPPLWGLKIPLRQNPIPSIRPWVGLLGFSTPEVLVLLSLVHSDLL